MVCVFIRVVLTCGLSWRGNRKLHSKEDLMDPLMAWSECRCIPKCVQEFHPPPTSTQLSQWIIVLGVYITSMICLSLFSTWFSQLWLDILSTFVQFSDENQATNTDHLAFRVGVVCGHSISSVCIIYGWRVTCRQRKTQRKAKERFDFWFQLQSELLRGKERKSAEGLILFSGYFCLQIYSDLADLGLRVAWNTFTFRMTVCLCNTTGQGRASTNSTGQSDWFAVAKWWLMFWANTSLDNM